MSWLLTLWFVPVVGFLVARRVAPAWLWRFTGLAVGAVVAPASTGLYGLYYVGPLAAVLGLVGLPLALLHNGVGYDLALRLGLIRPNTPVEGVQHLYVAVLSGTVWSIVYASIGWLVDRWSQEKARPEMPVGAA